MDDQLIKFDKTHASLTDGLALLRARAADLDLSAPEVEFAIQRIVISGQNALAVAKDRRDRETEPHAAALAEVKVRWRPLVDGFEVLVKTMKAVVAEVLRKRREEQDRLRREAEAKLEEARRKEAAAAQATNGEKREVLRDLRLARAAVDALPPAGAPIGIKTDKGTLSERKTWAWEVENLAEVPDQYTQRCVDSKKVDLAVENGVRSIPGIRIFEKTGIVSSRRR